MFVACSCRCFVFEFFGVRPGTRAAAGVEGGDGQMMALRVLQMREVSVACVHQHEPPLCDCHLDAFVVVALGTMCDVKGAGSFGWVCDG